MQKKIFILAVDDEPFNLDLIEAAFFQYIEVEVIRAKSGKEALELLEKRDNFDVVLLDISMPEMDGLEVLQAIRKEEKNRYIPILMLTANIDKEAQALELGANDFITKPYNLDVMCQRTLNYAKLHAFYKEVTNQKEILEHKVQERTVDLNNALDLAKDAEQEVAFRLGKASEFRDLETGGHIKRMSHYSALLAKLYGLDKQECELILNAAPLHDIGKVGISDNILLKPGRFTPEEFEVMKEHTTIGANILKGSEKFPLLKWGKIIAQEHHEKWDGSGYPKGKKGEEIHLYARIIALADVFDALSSKRCYKEPMKLEKVLSIIKEGSGIHFDPKLTQIFLDNIDKFLEIKDKFPDESN